ncbi:hypothetical protein CHUAL_000864 [Chamberlinius hualienensis]
MAKSYTFTHGDLVFAKCKGYPPWPARIDVNAKVGKVGKNRLAVFFFGTHEVGSVAIKDLLPYAEFREQLGKPQNRKGFMDALWEIKHKPTMTIDGKITIVATTENVKKDKKETITKKSVYSDIDSDSNDLIIDENIDIKARLKKTKAVMQANKKSAKRQIDEVESSLSGLPCNTSVPLRSRKRLKVEEPPAEPANHKRNRRSSKKPNDDLPVKLKIKIQPVSSAGNNKKSNSVRTTRIQAKKLEKETQNQSSSFERKDYLQDSRSRSRRSLVEDTVKPAAFQQNENTGKDVLKVKQADRTLDAGPKLASTADAPDTQKDNPKIIPTKAQALSKRELKEESKLAKEISEPVVTRTRCGRIVRTPAALDRDEEIIDLPGFKRHVTRQNAKKEVASSKLEAQTVGPAKKRKISEKITKHEDKIDILDEEAEKSKVESENIDMLKLKQETKLPEESEEKIVMTIKGLKSSKLSATRKQTGSVKTRKGAKSVQRSNSAHETKLLLKCASISDSDSKIGSSNDKSVNENSIDDKESENKTVVKLIKEDKSKEEQTAATGLEEPIEEICDDSPGQLVIVENQEESESSNDKVIAKPKSNVSSLEEQQSKSEAIQLKNIATESKLKSFEIKKMEPDESGLKNEEIGSKHIESSEKIEQLKSIDDGQKLKNDSSVCKIEMAVKQDHLPMSPVETISSNENLSKSCESAEAIISEKELPTENPVTNYKDDKPDNCSNEQPTELDDSTFSNTNDAEANREKEKLLQKKR